MKISIRNLIFSVIEEVHLEVGSAESRYAEALVVERVSANPKRKTTWSFRYSDNLELCKKHCKSLIFVFHKFTNCSEGASGLKNCP